MTKSQIMRRFHARACERPVLPRRYKMPVELKVVGGEPKVVYEELETEELLTIDEIRAGYTAVIRNSLRSSQDYFKLRVCPAGTQTVDAIRETVDRWCQDGFQPDILAVDYADLLHAPGQDDYRHKINEVWTKLRALSQHACEPLVITASQTNRSSYKTKTIGMEHTGEDKRKLAHVTAAFSINQTESEKAAGVLRINPIVVREDEANTSRGVYVAPCLSISNFCVLSAFAQAATTDEPAAVPERVARRVAELPEENRDES